MKGIIGGLHSFIVVIPSINATLHCSSRSLLGDVETTLLGTSDKVHYGKLFSLLMSKGLPKVVVRFILDGYIRQSACTQWEGVKSRSFNTFNGVKQGALFPRSAFLFTMTS